MTDAPNQLKQKIAPNQLGISRPSIHIAIHTTIQPIALNISILSFI